MLKRCGSTTVRKERWQAVCSKSFHMTTIWGNWSEPYVRQIGAVAEGGLLKSVSHRRMYCIALGMGVRNPLKVIKKCVVGEVTSKGLGDCDSYPRRLLKPFSWLTTRTDLTPTQIPLQLECEAGHLPLCLIEFSKVAKELLFPTPSEHFRVV